MYHGHAIIVVNKILDWIPWILVGHKKDKWLGIEEVTKKFCKHCRFKFLLLAEAMSVWIDQMIAKGIIQYQKQSSDEVFTSDNYR